MSSSARFFTLEIPTLVLAFVASTAVIRALPQPTRPAVPESIQLPAGLFVPNPADDPVRARAALTYALAHGDQVVFGSSELTQQGESAIQKVYPGACGRRVLSVGKAGFQSLPILLTLAGVRDALNAESRVAIILSPGWFAERGTPSEAFLKFLQPFELGRLMAQPDFPDGVRAALAREIRIHRDELTGLYPDWLYPTWPGAARLASSPAHHAIPVVAEAAVKRDYDWDAATSAFRDRALARVDNPYGVTPEYFAKIRTQRLPKAPPRLDPFGYEHEDALALSEFLNSRGVRADFVVQPIHRRIYRDLDGYDRLFADLRTRLEADGHRVTSYFGEPFDPTVLQDVAHFSEASWVRVARELCR